MTVAGSGASEYADEPALRCPACIFLTEAVSEELVRDALAAGTRGYATALCISVKTVETHRAAIMRKLRINSIVELVHYAIRNNLIGPGVRAPKL